MDKKFLRAEDIAEILDISVSYAYKVMKQLNDELKKKGYIVVSGRVSSQYFYERIYNRKENTNADI